MRQAAATLDALLNHEMSLHVSFCARWGVSEDDLLAITNFGQKSLDEVIEKLDERGLSLRNRD